MIYSALFTLSIWLSVLASGTYAGDQAPLAEPTPGLRLVACEFIPTRSSHHHTKLNRSCQSNFIP